jgi:hypothetical protein
MTVSSRLAAVERRLAPSRTEITVRGGLHRGGPMATVGGQDIRPLPNEGLDAFRERVRAIAGQRPIVWRGLPGPR